MRRQDFGLAAFVFMPEYVHMLVYPRSPNPRIDLLLKAIKRPFSMRIKRALITAQSSLLKRLTVTERPGVDCFRFWQEGGGYDRNLRTGSAVLAAIDYIHLNPVRRGLCELPSQWKWSRGRFYHDPEGLDDPDLPKVARLPPECFEGT
jgi:putative transposase